MWHTHTHAYTQSHQTWLIRSAHLLSLHGHPDWSVATQPHTQHIVMHCAFEHLSIWTSNNVFSGLSRSSSPVESDHMAQPSLHTALSLVYPYSFHGPPQTTKHLTWPSVLDPSDPSMPSESQILTREHLFSPCINLRNLHSSLSKQIKSLVSGCCCFLSVMAAVYAFTI